MSEPCFVLFDEVGSLLSATLDSSSMQRVAVVTRERGKHPKIFLIEENEKDQP